MSHVFYASFLLRPSDSPRVADRITFKGTNMMLFLRNFLQTPVTFVLLNLNILLRSLFSTAFIASWILLILMCHCGTHFLWADVDIALKVRMRQSSYASVPVIHRYY